jgi:DNA-3-methyladenine glycosylase
MLRASPTIRLRRLRRAELPIDTVQLARFLIGKFVVHEIPAGRLSARIVETEAYTIGDPACHAYRGRTPRNGSLFLPHGHAYVYIAYGTALMLNVSSEPEGVGAAVLLRAAEPCEGIELMQRFRGTTRLRDLARGPGRLAEAMAIDMTLNGLDLCGTGPLSLAVSLATEAPRRIGRSKRIGLTKAADHILRFYERGSEFVSGPKRLRE